MNQMNQMNQMKQMNVLVMWKIFSSYINENSITGNILLRLKLLTMWIEKVSV